MIIVRTWVINQAGRLTLKKIIISNVFYPFKMHDSTRHFYVYLYQLTLFLACTFKTNVKRLI